jgi:hypothetical protein
MDNQERQFDRRRRMRSARRRKNEKYPPPPGLVKVVSIALNPAANPTELDAALREARATEKDYEQAEKAYAEHRLALETAWRNGPLLSLDTVWGEWEVKRDAEKPDADPKDIQSYIAVQLHKAFMRFHWTGNSRPLLEALKALYTPEALASFNPESVAGLGELLKARSKPLKPGRPRGHINRWRSARQVAAVIVERSKVQWRSDHREDKVPADVVENIVRDVIRFMKTWNATKRRLWLRYKPLTPEKVITLLNEEKSRRL